MSSNYIPLKDLKVYQMSRELSRMAWNIYEKLDWRDRKTIGDQFIRSIDSVGANIAEGYARFHYLDKARFYYHSRGSLAESCVHWLELMHERKKISEEEYLSMKKIHKPLEIKLNNMITATKNSKQGHGQYS